MTGVYIFVPVPSKRNANLELYAEITKSDYKKRDGDRGLYHQFICFCSNEGTE